MFKQEIEMVGKIFYIKSDDVKTMPDGKMRKSYTFGMRFKNNSVIFIRSTVWNMKTMKPFTKHLLMGYEDQFVKYLTCKEEETKYEQWAICKIYPNSDGSMFDNISSYEKIDGEVCFSARGTVRFIDDFMFTDKNPDMFYYKTKSDSKGSDYKEMPLDPQIYVSMVVEKKEDDSLHLISDPNDEYPVRLIGKVPTYMDNLAEVGQGYKFKVNIRAGGLNYSSPQVDNPWTEEAFSNPYEKDYLEFIPQGIIPYYAFDIEQDEIFEPVIKKKEEQVDIRKKKIVSMDELLGGGK